MACDRLAPLGPSYEQERSRLPLPTDNKREGSPTRPLMWLGLHLGLAPGRGLLLYSTSACRQGHKAEVCSQKPGSTL